MSLRTLRLRANGRRNLAALTSTMLLGAAALAGCSASADDNPIDSVLGDDEPSSSATPEEKKVSEARLSVNLPRKGDVPVDTLVEVAAENGTLKNVQLTAGKQKVPGAVSKSGARWTAAERLEPGVSYRLTGVAADEDGLKRSIDRTFRTVPLSLDQQTYPSIAPLDGETVGVGMPVIVAFDVAVTDRAEVERHLEVESKPAQPGSWHWISDNEVHWRPKTYWKPGTDVTVDADINGVDAGNGIYGQMDRTSGFTVGDSVIMKIDVANHNMQVLQNGNLLRTLPISAGKPGFTTRSGIKVIIEKHRYKDMDAATTGISEGDAEYYNISNVEYAQRVTYSGEFLHAAPWSVGSQGSENVSHGCVGMSTEDAGWLYSITKRGDVVDVVGSDRPMEATNGYGDWNVSWADYRAGSALD
ncbi:MAG: putative lipoprotein [uncultured Nocardioidaceae bacterium]|uniref:Putative lipoprotein n=1 Tax=uncultured Nocardioidaceae bacterium TaxID=253824 RepID=A0A6J4MKV2_9ACTN|nr:MAG: putative lipoprotein [uncultured Nocardioidaceae bacterium]